MPRSQKVHGTMTVERGEQEIDVEICGVYWPGDHGSFWQPPEPANVEDVEATSEGKPFELTDAEYERAIEALHESVADGYFDEDPPDREDD